MRGWRCAGFQRGGGGGGVWQAGEVGHGVKRKGELYGQRDNKQTHILRCGSLKRAATLKRPNTTSDGYKDKEFPTTNQE